MSTTEREMQRQIGSLLWTSGEMNISTFEDEDIFDGRAGLLATANDGSKFQIVITKNEADKNVVL